MGSAVSGTDTDDRRTPEFQAALIRAVYETSPVGILVVDAQGTVVSHSPRFLEIWHIAPDAPHSGADGSAIGEPDAPLLAEVVARVRNPGAFLARVHELYADPQLDDHCEIELRDGRTLERHSTVLHGEDGSYLGRVWFFRDITIQKNHELALIQLSRHDPLTGVANRRYFFERAEEELLRSRRYQQPLSVVLMDVDHFKQVNDRYGHAAGDEVLRQLSHHSRELLREADLFARIGGEEFAVLMPSTSLHGARRLDERLRQVMADKELDIGGQVLRVHVSAGATQLRSEDQSIEDCLRRADEALYRAKQTGRNRVEISG